MYVAGVLMQLCCGALMWAGLVDTLSYIIVITALRVFSPLIAVYRHTKNCIDGKVTRPVVECVSLVLM